jgi:flagellar biosynthesis protein
MSMPKQEKAVALKYEVDQDKAPIIIASGYGEIAQRIIHIGEKHGIPIYQDDQASSILCMLKLGQSIPEELYQLIATIYIELVNFAENNTKK